MNLSVNVVVPHCTCTHRMWCSSFHEESLPTWTCRSCHLQKVGVRREMSIYSAEQRCLVTWCGEDLQHRIVSVTRWIGHLKIIIGSLQRPLVKEYLLIDFVIFLQPVSAKVWFHGKLCLGSRYRRWAEAWAGSGPFPWSRAGVTTGPTA